MTDANSANPSPSSVQFICPACGVTKNLQAQYAGRKIKCKCGNIGMVPEIPAVASLRRDTPVDRSSHGRDEYELQGASSTNQSPATGSAPKLRRCESCKGMFAAQNLLDAYGQILCRDCARPASARSRSQFHTSPINPEYLAKWLQRLMSSRRIIGLFGILIMISVAVPVPPSMATVLIIFAVAGVLICWVSALVATYKIAKALGLNAVLWLFLSFVSFLVIAYILQVATAMMITSKVLIIQIFALAVTSLVPYIAAGTSSLVLGNRASTALRNAGWERRKSSTVWQPSPYANPQYQRGLH